MESEWVSKCARNDEMNFILILKGKLSAPYRVYRVCLSRGQSPHRQKKEKTEKHKKAESGYAKRLQGNLQGENENEESENEYIILGGLCRLCLCLEQTHTHTHTSSLKQKTP